ncbi:MAG: YihY/virulence factor BrkB family protein [Bacteroidales bacterium]
MPKPLPWIIEKANSLNDAIWHTSLADISKRKLFLIRHLRIIVIAARGFMNDKVQLRSSALTFYSLLSVIPIAAIGFAIAKGFGLDQDLEQIIMKEFKTQPEVLNWLLSSSRSALEETKGGYIAGVGIIILFWSVMSLLDQIESSFNHIWQIRIPRSWYRKFTDYLTMMLIAPVLLILSSSITVIVGTKLSDFISQAAILDFFKPVISLLIKFTPYLLTWITLTILFMVMPNTKVRFKPAFMAGVVVGTILQVLQWLYIDLQFGISKLNAIYGSFAAIPLFIIWLQASWTIVLLGAELSFANQNLSRYEFESESLNVSQFQKKALVLMIMNRLIRNFSTGGKPNSAANIAISLKIPIRLVTDILQDLNSADLISIIHEEEHEERLYQPAMDINKLTVNFVLGKLEKKGTEQQIFARGKEYERVIKMLDKFDRLIAKSDSNILIRDL